MEVALGLDFFLTRLSEQVKPGDVLPLRALRADLMCWHPGTRMHWYVVRTKLMAILLLMYPHILE